MKFNFKYLCGYFCKEGFFIRLGVSGVGVNVVNTRPLYSERNGHKKAYKLGFGWRFRWLEKTND